MIKILILQEDEPYGAYGRAMNGIDFIVAKILILQGDEPYT
jgi:hypothetical protein